MNTVLRYGLGAVVAIPLLPIMYFQGKRIYKSVPKLPEAIGPYGETSASITKGGLKVITIGESTIAGVGVDTHENGFTGSLARQLSEKLNKKVSWNVYAKSGYTAEKISEKILPLIKETKVDLIVIGLGGNDAFKLHSIQKWRNDITRLIAELQEKYRDTPIVFTNMPPIKAFPAFTSTIKFVMGNLVRLFGKELEQIAALKKGVYYNSIEVKLTDWLKQMDLESDITSFFSDGVHPSPLAYQTWGADMARFIADTVELNDSINSSIEKNLL